jgi:outer membrane lipoprotein carrier protein
MPRIPLLACGVAAAVCIAAAGGPAPARAETTGGLLRCVQARYGALRDLTARFDQESRVASLGRPRTRAGSILFQARGRMRWEYDPPDRQLVVSDGATVWFYRPEQKQVVVQKIDAAFTRQTPMLFLFGKGDFAADFTWEEGTPAAGAPGTVRLSLRPRVEAPDLVRLQLDVEPGSCRLAATTIEDAFGNVTRLAFSGEHADTGLDAALFRFSPPAGTEVVRP